MNDSATAAQAWTETPPIATKIQWLSYLICRVTFTTIGCLPEGLIYRVAGLLGETHVRLFKKRQRYALITLRLAYPQETDDKKLLKLARKGTANLYKVALDTIFATTRLNKRTFEDRVDMSALRDSGLASPWIGVSGHLGGWECGAIGVSFAGYDAHVTARVPSNPLLNNWLLASRARAGLQVHNRRGGIRDAVTALDEGGVLVQAIDHHQRNRGVQAPWFGRMASCKRAAATIGVRRGYPLMVAASIRVGNGFRFKWVIQEVIQPEKTGHLAIDIQQTVEKINLSLETLIRRFPEQYLWIHHRYRALQPA